MKLAILALLLAAPLAHAAPVYLECDTLNTHSGKTTHYRVTLDETGGFVTFTDDGLTMGKTFTVGAQFTQADVSFAWRIDGLGIWVYHRIDRVSLAFSRNFMRKPDKTDNGSCRIAPQLERAF